MVDSKGPKLKPPENLWSPATWELTYSVCDMQWALKVASVGNSTGKEQGLPLGLGVSSSPRDSTLGLSQNTTTTKSDPAFLSHTSGTFLEDITDKIVELLPKDLL